MAAGLALAAALPELRVMSAGESVEIYKEVGLPKDVVARFDIAAMAGSHGIGHTRMATESAVTTLGAHPFSTGPDQCLVHNGSLSNHNDMRRRLEGREIVAPLEALGGPLDRLEIERLANPPAGAGPQR